LEMCSIAGRVRRFIEFVCLRVLVQAFTTILALPGATLDLVNR